MEASSLNQYQVCPIHAEPLQKPFRKRLKYLSDFGAVVWIDGPLPGEVFDVGGAAAADPAESRIDEATLQGFSAGVRLEVLDVRPDTHLGALEGIPRDTVAGRSQPAEVILPAMDVAAEAQVVRFEAHLAERHVVIDAFDSRLLKIVPRNGKGLAHVGLRILVQEERRQGVACSGAASHHGQRAAHIVVRHRKLVAARTLAGNE